MDKIKNAFTVASQHIPQEQLSTKFSTVVNGSTVATIVFVDAAGHLVSPAATYAKETAALAAELAKHASGDAIAYTKQHPYRVAGSIPFGGAAGLAAVPLKALGFGPAGPVAGTAAPWIQSTFYGGSVSSGSVFAVSQSIGMTATWAQTVIPGVGLVMAAFPGPAQRAMQAVKTPLQLKMIKAVIRTESKRKEVA